MKHHLLIILPALVLASCTTTQTTDSAGVTTKVTKLDADTVSAVIKATDTGLVLIEKHKALFGKTGEGK